MRAILIDPWAKTISEVDYAGGLDALLALLDCRSIDARRWGNGHAMFVDDEGALVPLSAQRWFVLRSSFDQPLGGKALIVGNGLEGDDVDATLSLAEIRDEIRFVCLDIVSAASRVAMFDGGISTFEGEVLERFPMRVDDDREGDACVACGVAFTACAKCGSKLCQTRPCLICFHNEKQAERESGEQGEEETH